VYTVMIHDKTSTVTPTPLRVVIDRPERRKTSYQSCIHDMTAHMDGKIDDETDQQSSDMA